MIVQTAPTVNYTAYAETILTAITDLQKKVNELYLNKDTTNARELIFSDYSVTIGNAATPTLSVSFTYNSQASQRRGDANYTHIFIRSVLAPNQDIWTLSKDNFSAMQQLLVPAIGTNGYLRMRQSNPTGPILTNVDFIAEQQVPFAAHLTAGALATSIQGLVTDSQATQQSLNQILSSARVTMPPLSQGKLTLNPGLMPVDNFQNLGRVAFARIGEWKMIQSSYSSDYPVSYSIGIFNIDVGSDPACYIQYAGNQAILRTSYLCLDDWTYGDCAWWVENYSAYLNSDSLIQPGSQGHFVMYYDTSDEDLPKYMCYGNAAYNSVTAQTAAELGTVAKTFYLSTCAG